MAATAAIRRACASCRSLNPVISSIIIPSCCTSQKLFTRNFQPYSRIPKKFLKPKNRDKKNRDDVYFETDQVPPQHTLNEAANTLRAYDLFGPETVDVILQVDMGEGKGRIGALKGLVRFPKPVTPAQKILVFAEGEAAEEAKQAGATVVGGKELIKQVEDGELEFDHCLCTLDFLPNIKHLPKILRNKMPNTRRGTATNDIINALKTFSHGESYVADNNGRMRQTIGLTSFTNEEIISNLKELIKVVDSHKTTTSEKYFKKATMLIPPGPHLHIKLNEIIL